jgi:RimJ/RimL family protein N-acetyltransferase
MTGTASGTRPLDFADKPVLTGERVLLRPVGEADAAGLRALVDDPEVGRLTGSHRSTFSDDDLRRWYGSRAEHDDRLDLAVVERSSGEYVGEVVLNDLDPDNRSCGFRIALLGPRVFGRGFGTEATRLALAHAFTTVGLHRVELEVYAFNPRARRVYEKVGFVAEGTRRQALHWHGEWIDAHVMAVLAHEWATHRGRPPAITG